MDKKPLKPAKLFIWDLDNVIYPYDEAFHRACHEAAARAAVKLGAGIEIRTGTCFGGSIVSQVWNKF